MVPPKERKRLEEERERQAEDNREALLFEVAAERFLVDCADRYSRPDEKRREFRRPLNRAFRGRYLDEIKRKDIRDYYRDRMNARGPFTGWRRVGRRTPDKEINSLSRLYSYLRDVEEYELSNPCHLPDNVGHYERRRDPLIADRSDQREAIFRAALEHPGRKRDGEPSAEGMLFQALFMLTYYTAARPESEPCKLRHGDIDLPEEGNVRDIDGLPRMGVVRYRNTKTRTKGRGYREVPVHPRVAGVLRHILRERPSEPTELEQWKALPIFPKRGKPSQPMDRASYRKAWANTIEAASKSHPELAGMHLRDLRATGKTVLIDAQVPEITVDKILGHKGGVREGYYRPDLAMRLAVLTLSGEATYPDLFAQTLLTRQARIERAARVG